MEASTYVTEQQTLKALGPLQTPEDKFFFPEMRKHFKPMHKPRAGEWLESHNQKVQLLSDYKPPYMNFVTPQKKTIYILPFGRFNDKFMQELVSFCELFYPGMIVKIMGPRELKKEIPGITFRKNTYGNQYLCSDILGYMKKNVPADAYCVMGITLEDIYPGPNWNFVYGWATYNVRVGIFSFIRWDEDYASGQTKEIDWNAIAYPSLRTMVHQIGHMFGVLHCVFYNCLMNGYNNIEENYTHPFQFCPVCFRKLCVNLKLDKKKRYEGLINYCKNSKVKELKDEIPLYEKLLQIASNPECKLSPVAQQDKIPAQNTKPNVATRVVSQSLGRQTNTQKQVSKPLPKPTLHQGAVNINNPKPVVGPLASKPGGSMQAAKATVFKTVQRLRGASFAPQRR